MTEIEPESELETNVTVTITPNPSTHTSLVDVPYDSSDRLSSTQAWLKDHPDIYRPYRKIKPEHGNEIWIDKDNNPVVRDVERERSEIKAYLKYLRDTDPKHYEQLQKLKDEVAPMGDKTRVAVNIPAWMEGSTIYRTLVLYSHQVDSKGCKLDPDTYEINIIVNRRKGDAPDN